MRRRNFVHKSALGVAGLRITSPVFGASMFQKAKVHEWLSELIKTTSSYAVSSLFLPKGLPEAIAHKQSYFTTKDFRPVSSSVYFYRGSEEYCFYPLERDHECSEMTEIVLLFFYKTSSTSWRHLITLNGYQLEALVYASGKMTGRNDFKEELLPVAKFFTNNFPQKFSSSLNQIDIVTVLSPRNGHRTSVTFSDPEGEIILQENFSTDHCLTCTLIDS